MGIADDSEISRGSDISLPTARPQNTAPLWSQGEMAMHFRDWWSSIRIEIQGGDNAITSNHGTFGQGGKGGKAGRWIHTACFETGADRIRPFTAILRFFVARARPVIFRAQPTFFFILSFFIREFNVLGLSPRISAAPFRPLTRQWVCSRTERICLRSICANVMPLKGSVLSRRLGSST